MGTVLGYGSLIVGRPIQANFLSARDDQNERREMKKKRKRKREKSYDQCFKTREYLDCCVRVVFVGDADVER
jgi:hypothetical protein